MMSTPGAPTWPPTFENVARAPVRSLASTMTIFLLAAKPVATCVPA
jgi:hypothetical protein